MRTLRPSTAPRRRHNDRRLPDLTSGPYIGMHDSLDPSTSRPEIARLLRNVYPLDRSDPSVVVGRPGFKIYDVGSLFNDGVQCVHQFTKLDGTEISILIIDGNIYTFDWGTETLSLQVDDSDFSSAGFVAPLTNVPVFAVTYNDQVVFSDNSSSFPFMWDGTSGAGGLTQLTNAPQAFGQPVVYSGRVFFIKDNERNVIAWSNVNDATTGYEAGGANNAWQVTQTEQEAFVAMAATDSALYLFREYSITAAFGDPTEFTSTPTTEAVSQTTGTRSARGVTRYRDRIFFVDSQARPHVFRLGGEVLPLDEPFTQTLRGLGSAHADLDSAIVLYDPTIHVVRVALPAAGQPYPRQQLILDPDDGRALAYFDHNDINPSGALAYRAAGFWKDGDGRPRYVMGQIQYPNSASSAFGVAGLPDSTDDGDWLDGFVEGAGQAGYHINHEIIGGYVGTDSKYEKRFDRLDLTLYVEDTDETPYRFQLDYQTPRTDLSGSYTQNISLASLERDQHAVMGLNGFGRWFVPRIRHNYAAADPDSIRFGFRQFVVEAQAINADPTVP